MSIVKLSNQIFDLKLTASELTVYAYMCSLPSEYIMLDGAAAVKVKQATIASKCGIKAVQTVANAITSVYFHHRALICPSYQIKRCRKIPTAFLINSE